MDYIESFVEGVAKDFALDKTTEKVNDYAEKHIKTKDPYLGPDGKKLKLRDNATLQEQKQWKWIQKRAWIDDKCFMGCYPVDCGIGLGPILVAVPCIGPLLMYAAHARLVAKAAIDFKLSTKTVAKLNANILFDLFLTFPPVIGSFFAWMNGCSTRNAAIIYSEIDKMLLHRQNGRTGGYTADDTIELHEVETGNTFTNPFKANKTNTATTQNTFPTQQYSQPSRPLTKQSTTSNTGSSLPPRDYTTPQRPNNVYQSGENTNGYRSVV